MEELSKFVIKSFECSKSDSVVLNRNESCNSLSDKILIKQQSSSVLDNCANNDENESVDIDITNLSSNDESRVSPEMPVNNNVNNIPLIKNEVKERDMRIFCIKINKTSIDNISSINNYGLKAKNWLLTESFKENKPQKSPKVTQFGKYIWYI